MRTAPPMAKPILDGAEKDPRKVGGLDYWIICNNQRAYLFLTSLNGKMWRVVGLHSALSEGVCNLQTDRTNGWEQSSDQSHRQRDRKICIKSRVMEHYALTG
ncbi:MAG: hypothetical protein ABIF19_14425 [Planctomycetota bacterium]